jgi:hypothetical protein
VVLLVPILFSVLLLLLVVVVVVVTPVRKQMVAMEVQVVVLGRWRAVLGLVEPELLDKVLLAGIPPHKVLAVVVLEALGPLLLLETTAATVGLVFLLRLPVLL